MHLKTSFLWLIGGLMGTTLSFGVVFLLNARLPFEVVTRQATSLSGIVDTQQHSVDGWSIQYLEVGPALLVKNVIAFPAQDNPGLPVRLKIPAIYTDAPVAYVGLTPGGMMDMTKNPEDVAWFDLGPRPGQTGSAVIAGHYGIWKGDIFAVFDNLHKLRPGDKVYVEDDKGMTTTFVVRESRRYDPEADASNVFGSSDGNAHLNLITCEGVWDPVSKSYSRRLVVFTDKEI